MYDRSPTHYRDRMKRGEYGEYREKPKRPPAHAGASYPIYRTASGIPLWQVMMVGKMSCQQRLSLQPRH